MHDDEVGVLVIRAHSHVAPEQVVGIQLLFQPLGRPPLTIGRAGHTTAIGWYQHRHRLSSPV
jgi:hypothetical protein